MNYQPTIYDIEATEKVEKFGKKEYEDDLYPQTIRKRSKLTGTNKKKIQELDLELLQSLKLFAHKAVVTSNYEVGFALQEVQDKLNEVIKLINKE